MQEEEQVADIDAGGLDLDQLAGEPDEITEESMQAADDGQSEDGQGEEGAGDEPDGGLAAAGDDGDGPGATDTTAEEAPAEETQGGQTVPLAVLLDERKGFQQRLDEMNTKFGRFETLQEQLQAQREARAEAEKVLPPEYLDDPQGYIDHKVEEALKAVKETQGTVSEIRETTEHQSQMQALNNRLAAADDAFIKAGNEDYHAAMDYVKRVNIENGMAMGLPEADATTQAAQAMFAVQAQVASNGIDPAKYMYEMAGRWGYEKTAPDPDPQPGKGGDQTSDETMDTLIAGEKAGSMGGGAAPTLEDITEMEDDEFAEAMAEEFGQKFVK